MKTLFDILKGLLNFDLVIYIIVFIFGFILGATLGTPDINIYTRDLHGVSTEIDYEDFINGIHNSGPP
jgi:hypothetical protein